VFVKSEGSAYARFKLALSSGDLVHVRAAAAELGYIDLADALSVCVLVCHREPTIYQRAALRWLARFCLERPDATLSEVERASRFLQALPQDPESSERELRRLVRSE
jgi:hypothetical protein